MSSERSLNMRSYLEIIHGSKHKLVPFFCVTQYFFFVPVENS